MPSTSQQCARAVAGLAGRRSVGDRRLLPSRIAALRRRARSQATAGSTRRPFMRPAHPRPSEDLVLRRLLTPNHLPALVRYGRRAFAGDKRARWRGDPWP